jgi:hypothetical protein
MVRLAWIFDRQGVDHPVDVDGRQSAIGEDVGDYRRKLAIQAKRLLPDDHELRGVQIKRMPNDAFEVLEPQILRACRDTAARDDTVPFDAPLRRVEQRDSNVGDTCRRQQLRRQVCRRCNRS